MKRVMISSIISLFLSNTKFEKNNNRKVVFSFIMKKKINIFIIDTTNFFTEHLLHELKKDTSLHILGVAHSIHFVEKKLQHFQPDICILVIEETDLKINEFLKNFLQKPCGMLLISSKRPEFLNRISSKKLEFICHKDISNPIFEQQFINELKTNLFAVTMQQKFHNNQKLLPLPIQKNQRVPINQIKTISPSKINQASPVQIIAFGASTGGTEALLQVLKALPNNLPPIVIVQHMPEMFTQMYAERLNHICSISVSEAHDGDILQRGCAYIAPGNLQIEVIPYYKQFSLKCFNGPKISNHRPSVDALFSSVASSVKQNAIGIIMTGMGNDGAKGMLKMRQAGAYTIGEDEASCVVYGMPMEANLLGGVCIELPKDAIASAICKYLN